MRPLRLTLEGFTAFREAQELDFTGLDLFAVVGPTGSGKSSLLDAMTVALYGKAARVEGSDTSLRELVSHGLPWMKVMFEFQVGPDRYRLTRRVPGRGTSGQTKVFLERWEGGQYRQAGEGADRVRDVNVAVRDLVGLDYEGFTRSVLLPQGKFADFLNGKPEERRKLLNDLLDLWLFDRMGRRARRIADDANAEAGTIDRLLADVYADATPEALKVAKLGAKAARDAAAKLGSARTAVAGLVERSRRDERAVTELGSCAGEVDRLVGTVGAAGEALKGLAYRAAGAEALAARAGTALREMEAALARATSAREETEAGSGSATALGEARGSARQRAETQVRLDQETAALAEARAAVPAAEARAGEAAAAVAAVEAALGAATEAAERAEQALEAARHDDLVAEVSRGLKVGDPCPVCGSPLDAAPKASGAARLKAALRGRDAAAAGMTGAGRERDRARDAVADAGRAVEAARAETQRHADEVSKLEAGVAALSSVLTSVLGDPLPEDPVAAIDVRLATLEALRSDEATAQRAVAAAREAGIGAEREMAAIRQAIAGEAARVEVDLSSLVMRATEVAPDLEAPTLPAPSPRPDEPEKLVAFASDVRGALDAFAAAVRRAARLRAAGRERLLTEARAAVEGLGVEGGSLGALATAAEAASLTAHGARTRADGHLEQLQERIAKRAELDVQVREHRDRARRFAALANELRADRIVDHLQGEALKLLCAAGSTHLAELSSGRYRFVYEGDEFAVVDTENGDERRSVRTLSGGETFLASLALSLALSEEVRSLSVTEKAPLESLFLDEGFGTLDPETLETVAGAIEQLGGDGRLVGIVTHVKELADRLPTRVEVLRAGNASRLVVSH